MLRIASLALAASILALPIQAQEPGDELFATDQVISIELTFAQPSFWDSLLAYYDDGLERDLMGSVVLTDAMGTYSYDSVGVRLKGNSSYNVPGRKKSMKIDFNAYVSGQKYHGLKKINLNNGFNDPTFLREKVFFDHCRAHGVLAPRVNFGDLTINGTAWGLYGVVEQVDKTFLDRWVGNDNGNLFKAGDNFNVGGSAAADLKYYGEDQAGYADRYELKTNETENDWSDLLALVDVLNNTTDDELATALPAQWEWTPLLRSLALDNLFSNLDSYTNSARNYYVYHDISVYHWNWIKWDANEAFGRYSGGPGLGDLTQLAPEYAADDRPLLQRIMAVDALHDAYLDAYCEVFSDFTNAHLDPQIDSLKELIQAHVYADPNKQYTNAQFDANITANISVPGPGPGGSQTVFGLKSFISDRRAALTGVLDCAGSAGVDERRTEAPLRVFPNPAIDLVELSAAGATPQAWCVFYDVFGREVQRGTGLQHSVSHLPAGAYVVKLGQGERRWTTTLVVAR